MTRAIRLYRSPIAPLRTWLACAYVRMRIDGIEFDLAALNAEAEALPERIKAHRAAAERLR